RFVSLARRRLSPRVMLQATSALGFHTLSLHDALPISAGAAAGRELRPRIGAASRHRDATPDRLRRRRRSPELPAPGAERAAGALDRKSTRLNSSHVKISYAVFCLKKKTRVRWPASGAN